MIKSIRPGKLRGKSDSQIQDALTQLFECYVWYCDGTAYIYCVDQYDSSKRLTHDMQKLTNVGAVSVVSSRTGVAVKLVLNTIARSVIDGNPLSTNESEAIE